jgi:enterochelin esterase-like enzyme
VPTEPLIEISQQCRRTQAAVGNFGELDVVSTEFIATLAVLSALAWGLLWFAVHRRRARIRHHLTRLVTLAMLPLLLTASTVASGVNSYFSYLPHVRDVVDVVAATPPPDAAKVLTAVPLKAHPLGDLVRLGVPDRGSGFGRSGAFVWLPPQYFEEPVARFPVVYLFHGSPGMAKDWFRAAEADQIGLQLAREGKPVIMVAPRMSHGWLDDPECVDGVHEKVETHLLRDVIPAVDGSLRSQADRSGRIFAGMSAGGYCALNMGLRNRSVAATVLDLSGFTGPTHTGGMRALFGPASVIDAARNTPGLYAAGLPRQPDMSVWLDSGSEDAQVRAQDAQLAPVLRSRGYSVVEKIRAGGHTYSVWRPALRDALEWALGRPGSTSGSGPVGKG